MIGSGFGFLNCGEDSLAPEKCHVPNCNKFVTNPRGADALQSHPKVDGQSLHAHGGQSLRWVFIS
jgi:hypothetical protein